MLFGLYLLVITTAQVRINYFEVILYSMFTRYNANFVLQIFSYLQTVKAINS